MHGMASTTDKVQSTSRTQKVDSEAKRRNGSGVLSGESGSLLVS
jgi:hypothetical protein